MTKLKLNTNKMQLASVKNNVSKPKESGELKIKKGC